MNWIKVDKKQLLGAVKERNAYRLLLEECLHVFNEIPRQTLRSDGDTYKLATEIEQAILTEKK